MRQQPDGARVGYQAIWQLPLASAQTRSTCSPRPKWTWTVDYNCRAHTTPRHVGPDRAHPSRMKASTSTSPLWSARPAVNPRRP